MSTITRNAIAVKPAPKSRVLFDASTRRAVPNFAAGLEPPVDDTVHLDPLPSWDAIRQVEAEYNARVGFPPAPVKRFIPSDTDQAWNLGYSLGRTMTPAAPSKTYTEDETVAFLAGYEVGHTLAEDEALANDAAYNAALDAMYADQYGDEPPYGYE